MSRGVLCGMTWRNVLSFVFPYRGSHEDISIPFWILTVLLHWSEPAGRADVGSSEDGGEVGVRGLCHGDLRRPGRVRDSVRG